MVYAPANDAPTKVDRRPRTCQLSAKDNMSIDAPCCQSDRLAVDHAEVANAKIRATSNAPPTPSSTRAMLNIRTVVAATIAEAISASVHECR